MAAKKRVSPASGYLLQYGGSCPEESEHAARFGEVPPALREILGEKPQSGWCCVSHIEKSEDVTESVVALTVTTQESS